jgi:hypothetical protein
MLSESPDGNESFVEYEGQKIYRATSKRLKDLQMRRELNEHSLYGKGRIILNKIYWALVKLFTRSGMEEGLVKGFYKRLEDLRASGLKIDCVVPCCMPVEGVKAGYLFCSKYNIPLFPLLYDRYSDNRDFFRFTWTHKLKRRYAENYEK